MAGSNNIGLIRLLLACGVIVSHSPVFIDGDTSREPLTALFHTITLGELCVDGFFLLSGYLITKSMLAPDASLLVFLQRRVLRIVPAFVVAYLLCVFVLGVVGGGKPWLELPRTLGRLITLQPPPNYPDTLASLPHHRELNGSMWTLAYEFRCYLLVAVLWACGVLQRRRAMAVLAAAAVLASIAVKLPQIAWRLHAIDHFPLQDVFFGYPAPTVRMTSLFLMGSLYYLYRSMFDRVLRSGRLVLLLAASSCALLFVPLLAEPGLATLGAFGLFWLALRARLGPLQRVNASWDISYGVYLYGWPVAACLRWIRPDITPAPLILLTLLAAIPLGALSWWGVEKRFTANRPRAAAAAAPRLGSGLALS